MSDAEQFPPDEEVEVLDALPVLPEAKVPVRHGFAPRVFAAAGVPAVQAAAVAAGGFVAGAAVAGLVHRRGRGTPALGSGAGRIGRALARGATARGQRPEALEIVSTTTMLVDVHVLGSVRPQR